MIRPIVIGADGVAELVVEIQRDAYLVEAELMGFHGIPQLHETVEDVRSRDDLQWLGAFENDRLIGVIAWSEMDGTLDIDRLVVAPSHARMGNGRMLVSALDGAMRVTVSTGEANLPARSLYESLGFALVATSEVAPAVAVVHYERFGDISES